MEESAALAMHTARYERGEGKLGYTGLWCSTGLRNQPRRKMHHAARLRTASTRPRATR